MGAFLQAAREIQDRGTFSFVDSAASTKEVNSFFAAREATTK